MAGKPGPRPELWTYPDPEQHQQHIAYMRMKAQAAYRKEQFDLTIEEFFQLWENDWQLRGRSINDKCMHRINPNKPWTFTNCEVIYRWEYLKKASKYKYEPTEKPEINTSQG